jgi:hypothetical protein
MPTTSTNDPQKIVISGMPDEGAKGAPGPRAHDAATHQQERQRPVRHGEEFGKVGLFWPTGLTANRDDLALAIGKAILSEVGV